jgi:acyl-CoA reductase-like NAD-dependent aldehyde dehydrogenase
MSAARNAQARWVVTPMDERLQLVRELRRLIADNATRLAEASASARHRPSLEALTAEVLPLAEACRFLEREAAKLLAPKRFGRHGLPLWLAGVRSEVHREPLGVVLIIGPGNYPLLLPGVQLIQALVAGNAVLLKPGVGGTAVVEVLIELLDRAGFDSHLISLLPESTEAARAAIETRPDKVIFTGSAATGEMILSQLAPLLVPATMELSGSDLVIVRADADLDLVTKALQFGLALNAGATCMAPKRVFVYRAIATELEGRLSRAFNGSPDRPQLLSSNRSVSTKMVEHLRELLSEAVEQGAHFIADGFRANDRGPAPVVLGGVHPKARLLREDVFAPVLAMVTVADDNEAIARANDCPYALGASIFCRDERAARSLASRLNAGVVTINDLIVPTADARLPFGGRKRSGFGVTRGGEGLLELTAPKVVTVSRSKFRPALEPSHPKDQAMFQAYLELTHGRGLGRRARALVGLFQSLSGRSKPTKNQTP